MTETGVKTHENLILPPNVVSKRDVTRLVNEAEKIDNEMTEATVRQKAGAPEKEMTMLSQQFTDFLEKNEISLENTSDRSAMIKELNKLKDSVPVVHMTFAVPADPESLQQIAEWLRTNGHPQAVIDIGLQPGLVAGVYMRTNNKIYDMSLRSALAAHRNLLTEELEALRGSE